MNVNIGRHNKINFKPWTQNHNTKPPTRKRQTNRTNRNNFSKNTTQTYQCIFASWQKWKESLTVILCSLRKQIYRRVNLWIFANDKSFHRLLLPVYQQMKWMKKKSDKFLAAKTENTNDDLSHQSTCTVFVLIEKVYWLTTCLCIFLSIAHFRVRILLGTKRIPDKLQTS